MAAAVQRQMQSFERAADGLGAPARLRACDARAKPGGGRKLTPADWTLAGFAALIAYGPSGVRVEPIARQIGATKGSFYWHFRDLAALHQSMLRAWEELASTSIAGAAAGVALAPQERILWLSDRLAALPDGEVPGAALEPAIRDWGRSDPRARATLARVDRRRIEDLALLLSEAGLAADAAWQGAAIYYAALIGLESLRLSHGTPMQAPLRAVAEAVLRPA